jgi:hypothetical protein
MLRKNSITVLLLLLLAEAHAQQPVKAEVASADFVRINEAYSNSKKLKMDVSYVLYESYTSATPFENEKGVFMKQNNSIYTELLGITSLSNSKVSLAIDANEKTMIVSDPASKRKDTPGEVDLDTLLKICSSITYSELEDGIKFYKLRFDNAVFSQYNAIDIYFDGKTFLLTRLVLYFREELDLNESDNVHIKDHPRLEISYSSIDTSPEFDAAQFSEARYINVAGKKITCTSSYASYRLINHKIS